MLRLWQAFLTVALSIAIFGVLGALLGTTLGSVAPTFVEWLMGPGYEAYPSPRPYEFAVGIGLMSGLGFGAFLGIMLVVLLTLRDAWVAAWTRTRPDEFYNQHAAKPPREAQPLD
jgi:hypothetical protein